MQYLIHSEQVTMHLQVCLLVAALLVVVAVEPAAVVAEPQ